MGKFKMSLCYLIFGKIIKSKSSLTFNFELPHANYLVNSPAFLLE